MDGGERKEDPSLPPDYVSLAQLQERWLQKQQEKKLKKEQEEEKKERRMGTQNMNQNQRGPKNDGHEKMAGGSVTDVLRRRVEKDGREIGAVEDKGKGKEMVIGGFENGQENKKKKTRNKNKKKGHFEKTKSAGDEEKGNKEEKEKVKIEIKEFDGGDGCEGVEIVPRNEVQVGSQGVLKGIEKIASVSMVEALPRHGVKGEIPDVKRMDFRGGLGRNGDNRGSRYESEKQYRVNELKKTEVTLALEKKMEDEKGNGKKWEERGKNGDYPESSNRLKESIPDVLKGNEVEPESEKKAQDEILEVCSEISGFSGRDRSGVWVRRNKTKEHRVEGGLNDNRVALAKNEVLMVESAKNGEKGGVGKGYKIYGNWKGNKACNVRSRVEVNFGEGRRYTRLGKFEGRWKLKQRESGMMWVKKEEKSGADAAEVGSSGISVDQE